MYHGMILECHGEKHRGKTGKDLSVLCSINEEVKMDEVELGLC